MQAFGANSREQQEEPPQKAGLSGLDALFADGPKGLCQKRGPRLPAVMTEVELMPHLRRLAKKNAQTDDRACFLGAGVYDHYIPSVVSHLTARSEFYTVCTPCRPEISEGTLQVIFEYQSMICALTGMDAANVLMSDGAAALAQAACLAARVKKRGIVLVSSAVNPRYREVLSTGARYRGLAVKEFIGVDELRKSVNADTAAVVIQTPSFFGIIEDVEKAAQIAHGCGALLVTSCNPVMLGLFKAPGALGADIAVGDGQPLGTPLSFGGPSPGFFALREPLVREMPDGAVGMTRDRNGKRGYVLAPMPREGHIRREKASPGICAGAVQGALAGAAYLSVLGAEGLREAANLCFQKAHYAYKGLLDTGLFTPAFNMPFFNEFAVKYAGDVKKLNAALLCDGILGGCDLGQSYPSLKNVWLVAVTEKRTKEEIDALIEKASVLY